MPRTPWRTPAWRRYARFFGVDVTQDVDDELRFHLEQKIQTLIAGGMPPAQARAEALRQFGEVAEVRRLCEAMGSSHVRAAERRGYWHGWGQDLRYAVRTLRQSPGFTGIALIILACGIGSTTAVASVVQAMLLRPLPVAEPSRVVWIDDSSVDDPGGVPSPTTWPLTFLAWQQHARSVERVAAYMSYFGYFGCNLTGSGGDPERLGIVPVTGELFGTLGVAPALGRTFTREELEPLDRLIEGHAPATVVLTDALWRRRFAADSAIVGRTITLNGEASRVVGVLPAGFDFAALFAPGSQVDLFTPMRLDEQSQRIGGMLAVIGRLRSGVTPAAAQQELTAITRALKTQAGPQSQRAVSRVLPLHDHVARGVERPLLVLAAAVALVLLVVCANVATLLLARAAARQKEMAVRAALGASRSRLLRQGLTESLLLAGTGALLGLPLAFAAVRAINGMQDSRLPLVNAVTIDARVLAFVVLVTIATGLLFGTLPAIRATLRATGGRAQAALTETSRGSSGGRERTWTRNALVVSEVAVACVLLVGAGLLLRSFVRLMEVDRGFSTQRIATARLDLGPAYGEPARVAVLIGEVRRHIAATSGAIAVGFTDALPLDRNRRWSVRVPGERDNGVNAFVSLISPGYLEALGMRLASGRLFTDADRAGGDPVVIVSQTLARTLWPDANPLGRTLETAQSRRYRVIGVIGDVRHAALDEPAAAHMYFTLLQHPMRSLDLVVRTAGDDPAIRPVMAAAVQAVDPSQPIGRLRTMEAVVARAVSPRRFLLWLIGAFAVMALGLASLGIFGVIAQGVAQRRREIGIRVALGATTGRVQRAVIGQALLLVVAGLAIGLTATFALTQTVASLLYRVSATDVATYVTVVVLLLIVALLAAVVPARRASRVDPASALRAD